MAAVINLGSPLQKGDLRLKLDEIVKENRRVEDLAQRPYLRDKQKESLRSIAANDRKAAERNSNKTKNTEVSGRRQQSVISKLVKRLYQATNFY